MNLHHSQSQFELFPKTVANGSRFTARSNLFSNLTLLPEHIIILSILCIMIMVLSFSLGVERGKRLAGLPKEDTDFKEKFVESKPQEEIQHAVDVKTVSENVSQPKEIELIALVELANKEPENALKTFAEKAYTIQVASFKKEQYAKKEANILRNNGYRNQDIFVLDKGKYSIVCVGSFHEKDQAKLLLGKLKKRYKDCLIRSL